MRLPVAMLALLACSPRPAAAQESQSPPLWTIEASIGDAFNFPTRLDVHQLDQQHVILHARYATPVTWAVRAARWREGRAWAVELFHHELRLTDPADPVDRFEARGFNLLTLVRLIARDDLLAGISAGVVIAHPENRVRGRELTEGGGIAGHYLAGPTGAAIVGWRRDLWRGAFIGAEARFAASYAHVPIADGHAGVVHLGLHGQLGLGWVLLR